MTVDNVLAELYLDGTHISLPSSLRSNWVTTKSVPFNPNTRVIAVHGVNQGNVAGILASSTGGSVLTSCWWLCTPSTPAAGWMNPGFDASSWSPAVAIQQNGPNTYWGTQGFVNRSAYWIWTNYPTDNLASVKTDAYCRFEL